MAEQLDPPPAVKPYFVQAPDEISARAIGWHMKAERTGEAVYLGHNFMAAELYLRSLIEEQQAPKPRRRTAGAKKRKAGAKA